MSKSYKMEQRETTLEAAIADAFSEIDILRDEMQEMESNMSNNNMEHLPKYETINEALQELEEHADQSPDVPEWAREIKVKFIEMTNRRKGRGPSRDVRLSNAQAMLSAAIDAIDAEIDGAKTEERKSEMGELRGELDEHSDFSVDFPGMFG